MDAARTVTDDDDCDGLPHSPTRRPVLSSCEKEHMNRTLRLVAPLLSLLFVGPAWAEPPAAKPAFFREKIVPILQRCVACHSGDAPEGRLTLTTREAALKGGKTGPALEPGDAAKSRLFSLVSSKKMPPKKPLSDEEIDALKEWITAGAVWEGVVKKGATRAGADWWSLQPLKRPEPPAVQDKEWGRNPIDTFVLAELEKHRLQPAPAADRAALLRRVTYDLHGLPPTPDEIEAFVNDKSPDAYEKVVDRLLASPRYGERWGRHWLDVARFAESHGFERDQVRDHAWRYRDYVIKSFNDDKPYPQFVKEQLAGDVLEPITSDGIIATGFLTAGPWDEVGNNVTASAVLKLRVREEELEEMIAAVGQTFLGLTLNCARCHDHKFDAITQKDYYRVKAVFDGVRFGDRSALPPDETKKIEANVARLKDRLDDLEKQFLVGNMNEETRRQLDEARDAFRTAPRPPLVWAAIPRQPGPTHILLRGDVEKKGDLVRAAPPALGKAPPPDFDVADDAPEGRRRLKFAEWVADPDNPLTARVMVNRVWHYHFGQGLVASPSDFGFNGERPTHPQLLDWLAGEFAASGGSVKKLHRLILLSATYRQAATFNARAAETDADDRLLWRFSPRRLEGEAVRDAMLSVSGRLNDTPGGPGYRPFTITIFNSHFYTLLDEDRPEFLRRTVYRINVNSARNPLLESFDCPDPSTKTPRRAITTTPLQALELMNNRFVLRSARSFAERVQKEAGDDATKQVAQAYRLALGREPTAKETERAAKLVREHGLQELCWVLFNASEFLYVR
jgi:hypothetical protein